MASALLQTKVYVPRPRRGVVPRSRLTERLNRGADESGLILVSAPAGFGKTTLLAEWLATRPADHGSLAWFSLDPTDNDPALFWTYLIAALQSAVPGLGASAFSLLESPQTPIEAVIATLLNEITALQQDVVLVLDDYHVVDARTIQDGMAFLLEHLPPHMHLVIATRADPALPLARLRAGGGLVEIRAADLRFTSDEAAAYLNGAMGLTLTAQDVAALEGRTEGWIAALQLAAISMQGRDDTSSFIAGFAGDDRYIVDYLIEEVLQRQPEGVRSFLVQTSILDRLTGPLCDAVTGQDGGKAMLEALDRGNVFLVPLDDQRQWYRYHHLFGDVLRARLLDEQPKHVPDLHRRASGWYEQNGQPSKAIRHALAGEDFERAADLVELSVPAMRRSRQEVTVLGWLQAIPTEVVQRRPVLSVHYAGALLLGGELEGVEPRLQDAERWLGSTDAADGRPETSSTEMAVVDEEEFRALPSVIATYRAAIALALGDVATTMEYAGRAFDLAAEDDHLRRGAAAGLLGLGYWTTGHLNAAHSSYTDCMASLLKAGHVADTFGCAIALADIRIAQGRLRDAMRTYEQALQVATGQSGPVLRGTADMHVGISDVFRERNDLAAAKHHLLKSQELGEHLGLRQNRYRSRVAMARVHEVEGDPDGALDLLDEAERVYVSDYFPNVRPIPALKARMWLAQGRLAEAMAWAREQGVSADDELSYLREFDHVTLARVLLARSMGNRTDPPGRGAVQLLERLLRAAEEGQRTGSVIEILMLQALAHQALGEVSAALPPLERALILAEPEGYVRMLVDEGPPMAALLEEAANAGITPTYVRELLTVFGRDEDRTPIKQGLVEPLSERELEVLRLLATDLDGPDIARELVVSLNTVRSHTKNIYAKLGVNSRRGAVRRAEELDVLSRARRR
jgi:LuxR family transcriptional regulator, maltose regulon positive regulatory protein